MDDFYSNINWNAAANVAGSSTHVPAQGSSVQSSSSAQHVSPGEQAPEPAIRDEIRGRLPLEMWQHVLYFASEHSPEVVVRLANNSSPDRELAAHELPLAQFNMAIRSQRTIQNVKYISAFRQIFKDHFLTLSPAHMRLKLHEILRLSTKSSINDIEPDRDPATLLQGFMIGAIKERVTDKPPVIHQIALTLARFAKSDGDVVLALGERGENVAGMPAPLREKVMALLILRAGQHQSNELVRNEMRERVSVINNELKEDDGERIVAVLRANVSGPVARQILDLTDDIHNREDLLGSARLILGKHAVPAEQAKKVVEDLQNVEVAHVPSVVSMIEQATTGITESDRALIDLTCKSAPQDRRATLRRHLEGYAEWTRYSGYGDLRSVMKLGPDALEDTLDDMNFELNFHIGRPEDTLSQIRSELAILRPHLE